ncbi:MAG: hypothetical protein VX007_06840, partial [Pseudomonadota bacterium]|nr:hypothetical protein [Pseudomonadota bacterium]
RKDIVYSVLKIVSRIDEGFAIWESFFFVTVVKEKRQTVVLPHYGYLMWQVLVNKILPKGRAIQGCL